MMDKTDVVRTFVAGMLNVLVSWAAGSEKPMTAGASVRSRVTCGGRGFMRRALRYRRIACCCQCVRCP